jgi:SPP1 family predicted phage head-tail adaptor
MNFGRLDRQLTLGKPTADPANEYGGEGQLPTFTDVGPLACQVEYKPGAEATLGQQLTATQRIVFTIRYYPEVRPEWQVTFEGRTFQITDVAEGGRRRSTILTCYSHG